MRETKFIKREVLMGWSSEGKKTKGPKSRTVKRKDGAETKAFYFSLFSIPTYFCLLFPLILLTVVCLISTMKK